MGELTKGSKNNVSIFLLKLTQIIDDKQKNIHLNIYVCIR